MKSLFIISLLAVMLLQTFSKVLILVDYQANKEYIMEFLCINREKPELHCEGHCYLQDKLKKQDQTEKQQEKQNRQQEQSVNLFCQELFQLKTIAPVVSSAVPATYSAAPALREPLSVFHPPQFLV